MSSAVADYAGVSETPGDEVLPAAIDMARVRYSFAASNAIGSIVVEAACGSGHGLGLLARDGRKAMGIDITASLLELARRQHATVPVVRGDVLRLPFRSAAIDTLVFLEAIYYLTDIPAFLRECRRVLRPGGRLLLCWANPEHPEFVRGAFTHTYPAAGGMQALLEAHGFTPRIFGGFPARPEGGGARARALARRLASQLSLVPATMRAKTLLKRAFYGTLARFPADLAAATGRDMLVPLDAPGEAPLYRVLYAAAEAGQEAAKE